MKIYTKTGDKGQTSLVGGERVGKDDIRLEAYGTIDELNSFIGLAISSLSLTTDDIRELLLTTQHHLLDIGSELASLSEKKARNIKIPKVTAKKVTLLEQQIDAYDKELTKLTQFILPGGCESASLLHVARTVCRRAERIIVALSQSQLVNPELIRYVNRLSDLLFTLARACNVRNNTTDVLWHADTK